MIWFALLCLTVSWECLAGVFVEPQPMSAFMFSVAGALGLGGALWKATHVGTQRKRLTVTLANSLIILVSAGMLQFLFWQFYLWIAPHFHAIPMLSAPLDFLLSAIGHQTTQHGNFIYLQTFKTVLPISITFEKLGISALCSFLLMGWVALIWLSQKHWARLLLELIGIISVYAVIRLLLLILLYVDMGNLVLFWNPIWIGISLLPLVAILAYFYPIEGIDVLLEKPTISAVKRHLKYYGILFLSFLLSVVLIGTEDPGTVKSGKILIDEVHSSWEWTTVPFDKEHYGKKTTYNYYCFRTWLDHYYHVTANTDSALTDALLSPYATLMIKTPTTAFSNDELSAIEQFVRDGGSLFLIGDHTNLYGMTTYINPVSERFGITFLPDDTFELSTGDASSYQPPKLFAHPTVHHLDTFGFMTSCTLSAPLLRSRTIMLGTRLGRENADYSHMNFFGNIKADINDEYGLFIQATARKYGKGRVVAFSDSTVFSNFAMFLKGKPELAIGIMEYLNRSNSTIYKVATILLWGAAVVGLMLVVLQFKRNPLSLPLSITLMSLVLIGSIFIGNSISTAVNTVNYRKPAPHTPYTRICFDQEMSVCRIPDILEAEPAQSDIYFDAFYTSIQRLGHYPALAETIKSAIQTSQVVVVIYPQKELNDSQLSEVAEFLRNGGKLLVLEKSGSHTYYTQQFQRLAQQESEAIDVPNYFHTQDTFSIEKTKVGTGDLVVVFGASELSHLRMGSTYANPTEEQKLKYRLAYFLFEEILKISAG